MTSCLFLGTKFWFLVFGVSVSSSQFCRTSKARRQRPRTKTNDHRFKIFPDTSYSFPSKPYTARFRLFAHHLRLDELGPRQLNVFGLRASEPLFLRRPSLQTC